MGGRAEGSPGEREGADTAERRACAERRRLPRTKVEKDYEFEGLQGKVVLPDLFEGRRQLILYHFMFGPNQDEGCGGCCMFIDQVGHPAVCMRGA